MLSVFVFVVSFVCLIYSLDSLMLLDSELKELVSNNDRHICIQLKFTKKSLQDVLRCRVWGVKGVREEGGKDGLLR